MKAIVTEFSQEDQRLTPSADRVALTNEYTIPSYFCIRVGRNASSWRTLFYRHSTTISLDRLATAPRMDGMERNIQQITMLFDALIIQVLAVRVVGHRIEPDRSADRRATMADTDADARLRPAHRDRRR